MTEKQFEYAKYFYENELERENKLNQRAQIYLSICSFFLTALLFKFKDLNIIISESELFYQKLLLLLSYSSIFIALSSSILTLNLMKYKLPASSETITKEFDDQITDKVFFQLRAADYLNASEFNMRVSNIKSYFLRTSLIFMIIGNLTIICFLTSIFI